MLNVVSLVAQRIDRIELGCLPRGIKSGVTPAAERGTGMVAKAVELARTHGWFLTRQFENEANPDMHSRTTAREILDDFAGAKLDYWVTGYGTGGTLKGVARVLRAERPETRIVVCEPADAPLLASGQPQQRNADGSAAAGHPAICGRLAFIRLLRPKWATCTRT